MESTTMRKSVLLCTLLSLFSVNTVNAEETPITTGATFYSDINYTGESSFYEENNDIISMAELNDQFNSVVVNPLSKVLAFHNNVISENKYTVYESSNSDLNEMEGVSGFKVIPKQSELVTIRFRDWTGSDKRYCLYSNVYANESSASNVIACNDDPSFQAVGHIVDPGQKIISAIRVRDMETGLFINNGSIYYTKNNNDITVTEAGNTMVNIPGNMTYRVLGNNRVDLILISELPWFPY